MALSHLGAVGGQDIVVSEDVHTVIMARGDKGIPVCFPAPSRLASSPVVLPFYYLTLSPMTFMPHPGVAPSLGPEVSTSQVVDLGGESEQTPVAARGQLAERAELARQFSSAAQYNMCRGRSSMWAVSCTSAECNSRRGGCTQEGEES